MTASTAGIGLVDVVEVRDDPAPEGRTQPVDDAFPREGQGEVVLRPLDQAALGEVLEGGPEQDRAAMLDGME